MARKKKTEEVVIEQEPVQAAPVEPIYEVPAPQPVTLLQTLHPLFETLEAKIEQLDKVKHFYYVEKLKKEIQELVEKIKHQI